MIHVSVIDNAFRELHSAVMRDSFGELPCVSKVLDDSADCRLRAANELSDFGLCLAVVVQFEDERFFGSSQSAWVAYRFSGGLWELVEEGFGLGCQTRLSHRVEAFIPCDVLERGRWRAVLRRGF